MPKFNVDTKLEHDGEPYETGSSIELSKKQAEPLLAINAISVAGKSDKADPFTQEQILEAMGALDKENEDLFTREGLPTTKALEDVLGGSVSAEERNAAWAVFNEE
ncbi:hypothetical protein [Methylophaga sp.]|uniref:hypothetical protein n=1 Tax=Methylophaga sp. TaxID=2024840 RepID=UPI003A90E186